MGEGSGGAAKAGHQGGLDRLYQRWLLGLAVLALFTWFLVAAVSSAVFSVVAHLGLAALAVAANWQLRERAPQREKMAAGRFIGILSLLGLVVVAAIAHRLFLELGSTTEVPEGTTLGLCLPPLELVVGEIVAVPIVEEVIFRRVLIDMVWRRRGLVTALVVSSAGFGAWHLLNGVSVAGQAVFTGALLGGLRVVSRGVTLPVIFHSGVNALATAVCEMSNG